MSPGSRLRLFDPTYHVEPMGGLDLSQDIIIVPSS